MKTTTRNCQTCQKQFDAPNNEVNRGNGRFCSVMCGNASRRGPRPKVDNVSCAHCGKSFYKTESKKALSKSGLFFCSRKHKEAAQRIGGIREIMPYHYGTSLKDYRTKAFAALPPSCNVCGYDVHPEILEVHHKDCNHDNNSIENLQIICPTCHAEHHFTNRTGKWRPTKALS